MADESDPRWTMNTGVEWISTRKRCHCAQAAASGNQRAVDLSRRSVLPALLKRTGKNIQLVEVCAEVMKHVMGERLAS